jgi:Protein of unknown function (DUF3987)
MNDPAIRTFLGDVLVWPGSQGPGWINLHVNMRNKNPQDTSAKNNSGKPYVTGWPFKDVDDFISRARWANQSGTFYNIWMCMSLQSDIAKNTQGKPKAVRKAANALAVKSIWIDIDIKANDPKHYPDFTTAETAFEAFRQKVGLPPPSYRVNSGGGLHIYWASDVALTPDEWRPYANGLKALLMQEGILCDSGLTTDIARILRVPDTDNHKYNPLAPVTILSHTQAYSFPAALAFLTHVHAAQQSVNTARMNAASVNRSVIEPGNEGLFDAPDAAFAELSTADNSLQAGIEPTGSHLVDPRPIFAKDGCPFLRHALDVGGADYDQPQWNLSLLCTAFMENGRAVAHQISKGHSGYRAEDTDALYDRKVSDRTDRDVGYPSCAAIRSAGSKFCNACPQFSKGKSPLNIRAVITATLNTPGHDFVDPYDEFVGPPFPLEVLSPTLRIFVQAVAQATGADPSAIAMATLTAVAGATNAETSVRLGDSWWEKPIIWTILVGSPSSMKSPIIEKATEPLRRINRERKKAWQQQHKQWLQAKQNKNNAAVPPPQSPRCVINDATPEKVAEILSRAPSGSLMVQDELAGWIQGFERYNSGSSRAFYLQTWNGGPFTKDRVGKGKEDVNAEIFVDNLALSILGGIQPDRLTKLGDLTADGLLQRFLPLLMTAPRLGDPYARVTAAEDDYAKLIRSINAAPPVAFQLEEDASPIRDDVMKYLHELEMVDGFPVSLLAAIGKLKGYFGRLCLVLQVSENHELQQPDPVSTLSFTPDDAIEIQQLMGLVPDDALSAGINMSELITRRTAERAEKLIRQFLLPHLFGFYDVVVNGGKERERVRELANFVLSTDKVRLRPSDFTGGVRSLRGEPDNKLREWVGRLCGMGWLMPDEDKPSVQTKAWLVAPSLREHFAQRRRQAQAARAEAHKILVAGGTRGTGKFS